MVGRSRTLNSLPNNPSLPLSCYRRSICDQAIRLLPFLLLTLVSAIGCRQPSVPLSDAAEAETVLTTALDSWASGATVASMRTLEKPIFIAEDLWTEGHKLVSYEILPTSQIIGKNICFETRLQTQNDSGKVKTSEIKYLVTSTPARTIARLDQ